MTLPLADDTRTAAPGTTQPEYLRLTDGCKLLSISLRSLYRLRDGKFINFYQVAGLDAQRVKRSELLALMEEERRS